MTSRSPGIDWKFPWPAAPRLPRPPRAETHSAVMAIGSARWGARLGPECGLGWRDEVRDAARQGINRNFRQVGRDIGQWWKSAPSKGRAFANRRKAAVNHPHRRLHAHCKYCRSPKTKPHTASIARLSKPARPDRTNRNHHVRSPCPQFCFDPSHAQVSDMGAIGALGHATLRGTNGPHLVLPTGANTPISACTRLAGPSPSAVPRRSTALEGCALPPRTALAADDWTPFGRRPSIEMPFPAGF